MNTLRKLSAQLEKDAEFIRKELPTGDAMSRGILRAEGMLSSAIPAWERLEKAARELLDACPCQNDCAPDDMTCASNSLREALEGVKAK